MLGKEIRENLIRCSEMRRERKWFRNGGEKKTRSYMKNYMKQNRGDGILGFLKDLSLQFPF